MKRLLMIVGLMLAAGMMAQADKIALPKESPAKPSGNVVAQSLPAADSQQTVVTIRKYLTTGAAGGKLPADFAVTILTQGTPTKESGLTNEVFQAWRFTSDSVSRLDEKQQPVATAKFSGMQVVCRTLRDGDWPELQSAKRGRVTPVLSLLGTPCAGGGESIIVTAGGNTLRVEGQNCVITSFADPVNQQRFDWLYASLRQLALETEQSRWGAPVNGLQLGIAPAWDAQGAAKPVFDGTNVQFTVVLRNSGAGPVRLLPSIYMCLLGKGDPLFVSKLVFTPQGGGPALTATYQGWSHLSLLDKNRTKGEQPQQTLNATHGKTEFDLDPERVKDYVVELAPGDHEHARVAFGVAGNSVWALEKGAALPAGRYTVSAVLTVDQKLSEWKGEITTGTVEVEIGVPAAAPR